MSDAVFPIPAPTYRWATIAEPDLLVLQLPPVATGAVGAGDAMRGLLSRRGFAAVAGADDLDLRPANGCLLTRTTDDSAELLIRIGDAGASRIPLGDLDPAWLTRAVEAAMAPVLAVEHAVTDDGTTSRDLLLADIAAGGVLGAVVPCEDSAAQS